MSSDLEIRSNPIVLKLGELVIIAICLSIFLAMLTGPGEVPGQRQTENASAARAHNLAIASFSYADDNNGCYPTGKTSTEIFQQLYNGKYLTQPVDVFLNEGSGKTLAQADPAIHLNGLNVSWDYTTRARTGLKGDDPGDIPLVFSCVAKGPEYVAGANKVTLDDKCPWKTDGVTLALLDQQCSFERPDASGNVFITPPTFTPVAGVTYVAKTP